MSQSIRLALVDQDGEFRQTIHESLEGAVDVTIVGQAGDAGQLLTLVGSSRPDVVLLDLATLHAHGLQVLAQLGVQFPHVGTIVLHAPGQGPLVLEALQQGALGHLAKDKAGREKIVAAIRAVSRQEAVLSPDIAGQVLDNVVSLAERQLPRP